MGGERARLRTPVDCRELAPSLKFELLSLPLPRLNAYIAEGMQSSFHVHVKSAISNISDWSSSFFTCTGDLGYNRWTSQAMPTSLPVLSEVSLCFVAWDETISRSVMLFKVFQKLLARPNSASCFSSASWQFLRIRSYTHWS